MSKYWADISLKKLQANWARKYDILNEVTPSQNDKLQTKGSWLWVHWVEEVEEKEEAEEEEGVVGIMQIQACMKTSTKS